MSSTVAPGRVLRRRRERGLSQRELAERAGVTRQAIAAIETGRAQPTVGVAVAIARALGASVDSLFGPEEVIETEAFGVSPLAVGTRAVLATIGGRKVARTLDRAHGVGLSAEIADGVVSAAGRSRVRIAPLDDRSTDGTAFIAGCEIALGLLARRTTAGTGARAIWFARNNRAAVAELAGGRVHAAAIHFPAEPAQWRRALAQMGPVGGVFCSEVAAFDEGWLLPHGNPRGFRRVREIATGRLRLANRPRGAGARELLDQTLRRGAVDARGLPGYGDELDGHLEVGWAIADGYADIGVGPASVARAFELEFLPLRTERCVLLVAARERNHPGVTGLIATLRSTAFRRELEALGPYDTQRIGEERPIDQP